MATASIDGVTLFYEEVGHGRPLVLVHEFYGDYQSWHLQVRSFARRYRTIAYNARGYPPSDVPADPAAYSQERAVEDLRALLDHLRIDRAHICGISMGAYTTLFFGLAYPERALSLTVAGCGSGSGHRERFRREMTEVMRRLEEDEIDETAGIYMRGPTRVQFHAKDPKGWRESCDQFVAQSAKGHALTIREVLLKRPSVYDLGGALEKLTTPALLVAGDEDEPCLEPGLFMKRKLPAAGLVVIPKAGHQVNLEEPEAFNRAVLDFVSAVDLGQWPVRDPESRALAAAYLAER